MKRQEYFTLFELFGIDPVGFTLKVLEIEPHPKDADFLVKCTVDQKLSDVGRGAAMAILLVHFRDRIDFKEAGEPNPALLAECDRIRDEIRERLLMRN